MAINNTLQNVYNNLLSPNPKATLPVNPTVPSLIKPPAQSALTAKISSPATPSWQSTLATVQSNYQKPPEVTAPVNPARPNQIMTTLPTSGLVSPPAQNQVAQNQANAAKLGISIPGVGGGSSLAQSTQNLQTSVPANFSTAPNQSIPPTNYQTPSGAVVNSGGGLISAPVQQAPSPATPPTYPGLVSQLAQTASQPSQSYTDAMKQAEDINKQLAESKANLAKELSLNAQNPIPLEFQQGRGQIITQQGLAQQGALASELQGASNLAGVANTQQQTQQTGLTSAANLAQPQLAGFNQQSFNPLTGQFGTGTGGGTALSQLPPQAQTAINSYAEQVRNGSMTRADAESRLSAYGVAGTNALNEVLGTGFNTNASNASSSTTAQGQQLQTAAHATTQALDSLQTLFNNLSKAQTGGIPATNSIANWIASALGSSALTQYNQTLHDARAQLQGVLTASGGATPTGAEAMAITYLPDNMTASQLSAAIANVKNLVQQKVSSFTQSGQQNNATTNTTGSIWSF